HTGGAVDLSATNINYSLNGLFFNDLEAAKRVAKVDIQSDATHVTKVEGNTVSVSAKAGDLNALDVAAGAIDGKEGKAFGSWVSGLIGTVFNFDDLLSLPVAVGVKISSASVLVGAGSQITGSGDVTLKTESTADANTEAIMADGKLSNALGRFGIAFSVNYAQTEATTLVSEGADVVSTKGN